MMFGGMLLGWLLPVILLGLGVMWLVNNSASRRSNGSDDFNSQSSQKTPESILKERYARGEITREEYQKMRRTLAQ